MSGRAIEVAAANAEVAVVPEPEMEVVLVMLAVACLYKKKKRRLWAQAWMMVSMMTVVVRQQLPLLPSPSP